MHLEPGNRVAFFLRISAQAALADEVAKAHSDVILVHGAVWFGVLGRRLSDRTLGILRTCDTLFMAQWLNRIPTLHEGKFRDVQAQRPERSNHLVPSYYQESGILSSVKFWLLLTSLEQADPARLAKLQVVSTGTPVSNLVHSMTSVAIVRETDSLASSSRNPGFKSGLGSYK